MFMEDETIKDTDKFGNPTQVYESLINLEATPSTSVHGEVEVEVHDDTPIADSPGHEDRHGNHGDDQGETLAAENQPTVVKRSERGLKPSPRYDPSEYVLHTDGGEPLSYD